MEQEDAGDVWRARIQHETVEAKVKPVCKSGSKHKNSLTCNRS
jgi:hypothetical protein